MKYLLDTCAVLWWWQDSPRLSQFAKEKIQNSNNEIYVSSVSAMEISTKMRLGKLTLSGRLAKDLGIAVSTSGWQELPLRIKEAQIAGSLDWSHRDPFDRLLAVQAMQNRLALLTCDPVFNDLSELKVAW